MLFKPNGWKVRVFRILGYASLFPASMCMLLYLVGLLSSVQSQNGLDVVLGATLFYLLMIGGMLVVSVASFWRYPSIRVGENGLDLVVGFYTKHLGWEIIKNVRKESNELFIFLKSKGLILNRMYGLWDAKVWDEPVVVFRSEEDIVKGLEEEINKYRR